MIFLPSAKFLYRPQTTVAPWTPLSLGSTVLYGWYKADAGLSVTTDGASITTWADQSGNTRDLTQSTAARRPAFRTSANGVNGNPVVEFAPGTTDAQQLVNTTFDGNASTGFSFYIVYQATSLAVNNGNRFGLGSPSRSGGSLYYQAGAFGAPRSMELIISLTGQWKLGAYGTQFQVAKLSRATTLAATKFKTTYGAEGLTSVPNNNLPAGFFLGGSNDTSAGTKIAEVIVCNKELTPTEEASLDAYFRSRYGFGLYYGADLPVANPALWLDASRSDSLFVENTLTTAVTTDNGPVGGWKDLSGNNRHALQATTSARPTWRTPINGQNGLGVMSFNGSSGFLSVGDSVALQFGTGDFTALVVASVANASRGSTQQNTVFSKGFTNLEFSQYQGWLWAYLGGTNNSPNSGVASVASATPFASHLKRESGSSVVGVNGTVGSLVTNTTNTSGAGTSVFIGSRNPTNAASYLAGSIFEVVLIPRAITPTELSNWYAYSRAKWGTP